MRGACFGCLVYVRVLVLACLVCVGGLVLGAWFMLGCLFWVPGLCVDLTCNFCALRLFNVEFL